MDEEQNRRKNDLDHDLIVEMHTLLKGMKENYDIHVEDDKTHFANLYKATGNLRWYIGIGVGILTAVQVTFNKIFSSK